MQLTAVLDDQGCNTTEAQKLKIKPAVSACKYLPGACYFLPDSTLFWEAVLLAEGCALLTALHLASASRCPSTLSRGILAGWHQTASSALSEPPLKQFAVSWEGAGAPCHLWYPCQHVASRAAESSSSKTILILCPLRSPLEWIQQHSRFQGLLVV